MAPETWGSVFGESENCPEATVVAQIAIPPRLSFWDHAEQQFSATHIFTSSVLESQTHVEPATQWELALNAPAGFTLTVAAQRAFPVCSHLT